MRVKHVVVVLGSYYPDFSAVGKCMDNIIQELKGNFSVTVVSCNSQNFLEKEKWKEINIERYYVEELSCRYKLEKQINASEGITQIKYKIKLQKKRVLRCFKMLFNKVSIEKNTKKEIKKILKEINERKNIDIIISASMPIEAVLASCEFSEEYKTIKHFPFLFDPFSINESLHLLSFNKKIKMKKHIKIEKYIVEKANKVFIVSHLYEYFDKLLSAEYKRKVIKIEHPLLKKIPGNRTYENDFIKLIYAGTFLRKIRNPEKMLKIISQVLKKKNYEFNIFSMGNCKNILEKYKNSKLIINEPLKSEEIYKEIQNSDILISVGNSTDTQAPSKIYEYISTGKPIIHFIKSENDEIIDIFKSYKLGLIINENDNIDENVKKILNFIDRSKNEALEFEEIEKIFKTASPQYISRKIVSLC